jgi:hypothetical protein
LQLFSGKVGSSRMDGKKCDCCRQTFFATVSQSLKNIARGCFRKIAAFTFTEALRRCATTILSTGGKKGHIWISNVRRGSSSAPSITWCVPSKLVEASIKLQTTHRILRLHFLGHREASFQRSPCRSMSHGCENLTLTLASHPHSRNFTTVNRATNQESDEREFFLPVESNGSLGTCFSSVI